MENPFGSTISQEKSPQELSEAQLERELRLEVKKTFEHLVRSSIGEGNDGIVVGFDREALNGWCAKFHKLEYHANEFQLMQKAFALGKQVPRPFMEIPEKHLFIMEKLHGETLEELFKKQVKFSSEFIEELEEISADFCEQFTHGDFFPRNIFVENPEIEEGILLSGTPIIIDLDRSSLASSDEYQKVHGWFGARRVMS